MEQVSIEHLETIMGEFREAIVICDLWARILLFNPQAKKLVRNPGALNLGRSLWGVCHPAPFAEAFRAMQQGAPAQRRQRFGEEETERRFVCATVQDTMLLHCHLRFVAASPFRDSVYLLTFSPIPRQLDPAAPRGSHLNGLIEELRGPLANLHVAAETLQAQAELSVAERRQFEKIIAAESADLIQRFEALVLEARAVTYTQWPLADLHSADLLRCVARELRKQPGLTVTLTGVPQWLHADAHSLMLTLEFLVMAVQAACHVSELDLEVRAGGRGVYLDIVWRGAPVPQAIVEAWTRSPLPEAAEGMTVADVLVRHNSDLWSQAHQRPGYALLRLPAPAARGQWVAEGRQLPERPAFHAELVETARPVPEAIAELPLAALSYVVFDTETTGLCPAAGDDILSIAGVRIVKGRILADDFFCSLVNPRRPVPEPSVCFHGITTEAVRGQPPLTVVLSEFRSFVDEAVLVAHDGAFDLQFIQRQEESAGVKFDQPRLDTQLLSMVADAAAADHSLAAIGQRLGVTMEGRHTALGDCWITAQIFLALLERLGKQGITTLGQALAASQRVLALSR